MKRPTIPLPRLIHRRSLPAALAGIALFCLGGCFDRVAGSTSTGNTGKGTISGRVVGLDGQGIPNARVTVVGVDHNPGPGGAGDVAAIVYTASDGSFRTDSLADGLYNLLDAQGGEAAFVDSVAVRADTGSFARDAVLKPAGSVTGVIRLRPGHDSRTVFLILTGTTTFAVPGDSVGNFALSGLAEGEYRLRLLSTLDAYAPLDTSIRIASGRNTVLPDTLRLAHRSASALPEIDLPALAYDSALLQARVSWPRQPAPVTAYHVYRRTGDSGFVRLTPAPIADTFLLDSKIGIGRVYEYAVTTLDARGNESLKGLASALPAGLPYAVDTAAGNLDGGAGACHFDVDARGDVWLAETGGIRRVSEGKTVKAWQDTVSGGWLPQIKVDESDGVYLLAQGPLRVVKYDTAGNFRWSAPLPFERDVSFELHLSGDTVLVWAQEERVMTSLSRAGAILRQDTLLGAFVPPFGTLFANFRPGVGFFVVASGNIILLDREGRETSRWAIGAEVYSEDIATDPQGRWHIAKDSEVEVYSPDRALLRRIQIGGTIRPLFRAGALYLEKFPGYPRVVLRVRLGL